MTGVKFTDEDLKYEEPLWCLYERWGACYNVMRNPVDKLHRFTIFKDAERHVHLQAIATVQAPGLTASPTSATTSSTATQCNMPLASARRTLPVRRRSDGSLPLPVSIHWGTKRQGQIYLGVQAPYLPRSMDTLLSSLSIFKKKE
ncbi:ervatamin-C-like [Panicum miliaceum]|uniref:Ervatamin-C-like n=1 Tax=Panicum miliaceum TaxID=4540 RepID=A0A3L6TFU9_PANMI|nr:ervatamin-C-like [Panicum miliaceum]